MKTCLKCKHILVRSSANWCEKLDKYLYDDETAEYCEEYEEEIECTTD